jgi:hypothetical protein
MSHPVPPYGVAIQQAIAKGDLAHMKQVAKDVEDYLNQAGNLPAALTILKAEIAKAEKA